MSEGIITQVVNSLNTYLRNDTENVENELDKDSFLQLLVTELRYQDPLSPMDNKEFISQMAQFSSLEQMQNMNKNIKGFLELEALNQGVALIGKNVEALDPDSGGLISGKVESISLENGRIYACLDNTLCVEIKDITTIS
jgi:flagellar basal-body rod modification protein FlgD